MARERVPERSLSPVTVYGKLCALLAVKAVSFDYERKGIEMEAGRPGWNDSLNGLPALFGSSTCEAAEVVNLVSWLRRHVPDPPDTHFPVEVADSIEEVIEELRRPEYSWHRAATLREEHRARIRGGGSGRTRTVEGPRLAELLAGVEELGTEAVRSSVDADTGLIHTYYIGEPAGIEEEARQPSADRKDAAEAIQGFTQRPLPLYLEGQVHLLRLQDTTEGARRIFHSVRSSALFDPALKMYKVNECLDECPPEIGRARTFTRGWLENESIWLHMSYRYLLGLLRAGLYEEFFEDAETMLIPFMDPAVYGRSTLENSSFLGSSANPDSSVHGRGFVARLSGSTAEFIHMWLLLTVGPEPFFFRDGRLHFGLRPVLPGRWFTQERSHARWKGRNIELPKYSFACTLLGTMLLVYHNESRQDTFGQTPVKPVRYLLDEREQIEGGCIGGTIAAAVRERRYARIDVWLDRTDS